MDNAALGVLTEKLVQFGLTRQEATIYMCLLRSKDLSGADRTKARTCRAASTTDRPLGRLYHNQRAAAYFR